MGQLGPRGPCQTRLDGGHGNKRGQLSTDETGGWARLGMRDMVGCGCWVPGRAQGVIAPELWEQLEHSWAQCTAGTCQQWGGPSAVRSQPGLAVILCIC